MSETALLVIDVQTGFFEATPPIHHGPQMLQTIQSLIQKAEDAHVPVIYIRHDEAPEFDGPLHPEIAPKKGEKIIPKMTPDSFFETDLQDTLGGLGVKNLVICGFQTEFCIDTTTRRAKSMGYTVTVVEDAHSTFDSEILDAQKIIAHHSSTLRGFASVIPAEKVTF